MNKTDCINILSNNGFNCFPIPAGQKAADSRYKGALTEPSQDIKENENYGYIPIKGSGTCIVDFDDTRYYEILKQYSEKFMVISTPHGLHLPIKGIGGEPDKIELFDYDIQDKKIVEIQGPNHYCVGPGSYLDDKNAPDIDDFAQYTNIGTELIFDVKGTDFHDLITRICEKFHLTGRKKENASSYKHMRDRFKEGLPPTAGQSNDYFNQAAMVCNTNGLDQEEATTKIEKVYLSWVSSKDFSGRPWSNIFAKIQEVYSNDMKVYQGNHQAAKKKFDESDLAQEILDKTPMFSDPKTRKLFITENGFLEDITVSVIARLARDYRTDKKTTAEVIHFLIAFAPEIPEVNTDGIRFDNGIFDLTNNEFRLANESEICLIGYKGKKYHEQANPTRFIGLLNEQVLSSSLSNLKAWLSTVATPYKEIKMAVLYGLPGTGKTALAETLEFCLGEYGQAMTMTDFFKDRATAAQIIGKTLLYFQDTPKKWDDIDRLKQITGETRLNLRGMYESAKSIRNMLSIVISTNNLAKINSEDEGPMFDRLTLIQFSDKKVRGTSEDDKRFAENVANDEGELIISYCLNLRKENNEFDDAKTTLATWRNISCPELRVIKQYFKHDSKEIGMSIFRVIEILHKVEPGLEIESKDLIKSIRDLGYSKKGDVYMGMVENVPDDGQSTLPNI